jgi:hypothetical protein
MPLLLLCLVHCEVGGEGVPAEVEDPLEVVADEEAVGEFAERPVGDGVADAAVDLASPLAVGLEDVGVCSQSE